MAIFSSKTDLPAPLTSIERAELIKLEATITAGVKAFAEAGKALARIRDKQLYRESHNSFESYVAEKWQMSRSHAARLIEAAAVVANLSSPNGDVALPASEFQARQLAELTPESQKAAWEQILKEADGKPPTTAAIVEAVAKRKPAKKGKRKARPRPTRILVPGGTVIFTPNRKFGGSVIDALESALNKLEAQLESQASSKAA